LLCGARRKFVRISKAVVKHTKGNGKATSREVSRKKNLAHDDGSNNGLRESKAMTISTDGFPKGGRGGKRVDRNNPPNR